MNTMFLLQNSDPGNGRALSEQIQESILVYPHEINITEGGEFLDDAIRTKDQPLLEKASKADE
jgi:hypothetical protein